MGIIANQMALDMLLRLKQKLANRKEARKQAASKTESSKHTNAR